MTDNFFEIETAAIALRTCYSEDPGMLLTDFSCANPSVDHRWIFMVYCNSFFEEFTLTPSQVSSMPALLEVSLR